MRGVTCYETLSRSLEMIRRSGSYLHADMFIVLLNLICAHYNATPDIAQNNTPDSEVRQDTDDRPPTQLRGSTKAAVAHFKESIRKHSCIDKIVSSSFGPTRQWGASRMLQPGYEG